MKAETHLASDYQQRHTCKHARSFVLSQDLQHGGRFGDVAVEDL